MDRAAGWVVIDEQREQVAALLESLTAQEWDVPSSCSGWTLREVGAHLAIAATMPLSELSHAVVRARGRFNRMIHDTAIERARLRTPQQIVDDLRGLVGSRRLAPSTFWRDPLLDLLVHGQDIARPIGRSFAMPVEAARTSADWAWHRGYPFLPAWRLRGVRLVATDTDWTRGHGEEVRGPIAALLLLSTGRASAVANCAGSGLHRLPQIDTARSQPLQSPAWPEAP